MAGTNPPGDLYKSDSTVTSARAQEVCAYIARYSLRQEFQQGKAYIAALSVADLSELFIASNAVSLYVQDGDHVGARDFLGRIDLSGLLIKEHALLDPNVACLALFSAWIDCCNGLRMVEGIAMAAEVDQIYTIREWDIENDFQDAETMRRAAVILHQRQLWNQESIAYGDSIPITDARATIEDILLSIQWRAMDCCMATRDDFQQRLQTRYPPLLKYLSDNKRTLVHAGAMFAYLPALSTSIATSTVWQVYLEELNDPDLCIIKACALSSLVYYCGSDKAAAAQVYFEQAAKIFAEQDCQSHNACLMLNHWRTQVVLADDELVASVEDQLQLGRADLEKVAESLVGKAELVHQVHAKKRMDSLFAIHKVLIDCGSTLVQVMSVIEAIELAAKHPLLWHRVQDFLAPTLVQLVEKGDAWHAQLIQFRYYLPTARLYDRAEEARAFFERIIATRASAAVPDLFLAACVGMWRACSKMADNHTALKYALKDYEHDFCVRHEHRRSEALVRVAESKIKIIKDRLERELSDEVKTSFRTDLEQLVVLLETWIDLDQVAGRHVVANEKSDSLKEALHVLTNTLKIPEYAQRHQRQVQIAIDKNKQGETTTSFAAVMHLVSENKWTDAIEWGEKMHKRVLNDTKLSLVDAARVITGVVGVFHAASELGGPMPEETREVMLLQQHEMIMSDLQALRLAHNENYLIRAVPMMWTFVDCVKTWPERTNEFVLSIATYFEQAQELCLNITRRITSQLGIQQWLRKRDLGAEFHFSHICQVAAEFFLKVGIWKIAWAWIQRGRAPALRDMLHERRTARQRLLMSLEERPEVTVALAEEQKLLQSVQQASPSDYFEAHRHLELHRAKMRALPALQNIIDPPTKPGTILMDEINDIWELKKHLPKETGIVLVDWFIDTRSVIWRLDVSYAERDSGPRWTRGYINVDKLKQWKQEFLNFPLGGLFALEYRMKALHQLRALLTGLDVKSKPGDLLIISAPGELSTIPIHGIPFEGQALIERNPVLYTGGLNLFRQCIKNAKDRTSASLLDKAVFASAYEQDGHESERSAIFSHLESTAAAFHGTALLADQLTVGGMRAALKTASWIHYHGHAYYARTEALNQCLVLGRLSQIERQAQSRLGTTPNERLAKTMPYEAPLSDREALLSSSLLEGSSRLTVADIFAMDLSTAPVVINIACDSGVQDFSLGNDPLGLVSALFCAGASSVVGTLWPIRSSTGRLFSTAFYESLRSQTREAGSCVNLAFAFRHAVLAVKTTRRAPYEWAAFTLQGAPLYFYRGQTHPAAV